MKAYICIGGPLNGQHATSKDFAPQRMVFNKSNPNTWNSTYANSSINTMSKPAGRHFYLKDQYLQYNCGKRGMACSMVWLHISLLIDPVQVT